MSSEKILKIIFVLDSTEDIHIVDQTLQESLFEIHSLNVKTEKDFLSALDNFNPDIIVSKDKLSKFSCKKALKTTLEQNKSIDFIVLSEYIDEHDVAFYFKAGATDYVTKKQINRLLDALNEIYQHKKENYQFVYSDKLLSKIFEILPIGLWIADKNGKLLKGNPKGVEIWGAEPNVGPEEYGVFKARSFPEGKEIEAEDWALAATINKGITIENELLEIDTFDGKNKIIANYTAPVLDDEGELVGAIIINNDVTQKTQADIKLQKTEGQLRTLLNTIPDIVWLKDLDGVYLACNSRFELFFGAIEKEIVGKTDYDFVGKELADSFTKDDKKTVKSGVPTLTEEEITFAYDGHKELLETIKVPMYDHNKRLMGVLGIGRDITKRKSFETSLLENKLAAESANKIKSEFLANMSHELRTPLNSIIGFSQILADQRHGELNEKQIKYASTIAASGKHLLEVVNSILDISKSETNNMRYEPEKIDLSVTIGEIRAIIEPLATKKFISTKYDINIENAKIFVDQVKFKSILYNLLSNAIKYTPENGEVCLNLEITENSIKFSVSDNGIGIAKENHSLVFEPFKQAGSFMTREYGGTGLGLALVDKYVEMHNGTITIESEVGKGSTFTVILPRNSKMN